MPDSCWAGARHLSDVSDGCHRQTTPGIITHGPLLDGSDDTPFDCGAVATALVNAAWSRGLGAVINSQGIMQSPVVREHAGIADDQVIMKSIALGWPDETFPANAVVSERKSVEEATVFVGFEK